MYIYSMLFTQIQSKTLAQATRVLQVVLKVVLQVVLQVVLSVVVAVSLWHVTARMSQGRLSMETWRDKQKPTVV